MKTQPAHTVTYTIHEVTGSAYGGVDCWEIKDGSKHGFLLDKSGSCKAGDIVKVHYDSNWIRVGWEKVQ